MPNMQADDIAAAVRVSAAIVLQHGIHRGFPFFFFFFFILFASVQGRQWRTTDLDASMLSHVR
jgi:hypothetical protein